MIGYRQEIRTVQMVDEGPVAPRNDARPCCAWCGYVIPADCPDDDFDLAECSIRWRLWRNGPVPEAPPVEPLWVHALDGVAWDKTEVPEPLHVCFAWSTTRGGIQERCPCGAVRYPPGYWHGRNSRPRVVPQSEAA